MIGSSQCSLSPLAKQKCQRRNPFCLSWLLPAVPMRLSFCEIRALIDDDDDNSRILDDNDDDTDDEHSNLVNQDPPQCRICFDTGGDDLIAPCNCRGTQKYVHRSCLDHWRSTKEGFAFAHCTECRALFILRANVPSDGWWLKLKFQLLVVRDHFIIFVIVQLVAAILGLLVYRFYGEKLREMFGYEEHPYGFYTMASVFVSPETSVNFVASCYLAISEAITMQMSFSNSLNLHCALAGHYILRVPLLDKLSLIYMPTFLGGHFLFKTATSVKNTMRHESFSKFLGLGFNRSNLSIYCFQFNFCANIHE